MEEATTTPQTDAPAAKPKKRKVKRSVPHGQIHIFVSFNNTIITVTDLKGGAIAASSAGACGFRGSKKGTAYAAQVAAEKAIKTAQDSSGLIKADIFVKGIGQGRDPSIRTIISQGVAIESITDKTGVAHGGTRPRKARRV